MSSLKKNNKVIDLVAVALKYKAKDKSLPTIIASGKGELAKNIIDIGKNEGILIEKNEELAGILSLLEIEDTIPIETFAVVAEIISYIYQQDRKAQKS